MQDVQAAPITWHVVGPELCGSHGDVHSCSAGWCLHFIYPGVCFHIGVSVWNVWQYHDVIRWFQILKQDLPVSYWSCLHGVPYSSSTVILSAQLLAQLSALFCGSVCQCVHWDRHGLPQQSFEWVPVVCASLINTVLLNKLCDKCVKRISN